jgi:hypothetical protein
MGILALLAFLLAFIFHAARFAPAAWYNWQGMALAGFVLLTAYLVDWEISWRRK